MDPEAIMERVRREAADRLTEAAAHVANEVKVTLSTPAPRRSVRGRDGRKYVRAATPATPGAPPRKLTGRLRASISYTVDGARLEAVVGTNTVYGRPLEENGHPFARVTLERERAAVDAILAGTR